MQTVHTFQPSLVSCHSGFAGFMGRISIRNRVPTIFTAHGWSFSPGGPLYQRILTLLAEYSAGPFCKKIICVSYFDEALARKLHAASPEKIVVIHNGVELPEFVPIVRSQLRRIVFVARLAPQKMPLVLLEALMLLPASIRDHLSVNIIGDGPLLPELTDFIRANSLETIVSLPGALPRAQVLSALSETDLFVLVTGREGLPRSIIEALSRGAPAIGSNTGGIPELITPDVGYVLPKQNEVTALAAHIEYLYKNPDTLRSMSIKAYQRAREQFSIETTIEHTLKVYEAVLSA